MNLGQVSENYARKLWFQVSFSKLCADDLSSGELICLLV